MLHPNQFYVNEVWIVFKLNDAPLSTQSDGDFNLIAIMDAASCFILSSTAIPIIASEPSTLESKHLLKEGQAYRQQLPKTLFISNSQLANLLTVEAENQDITVVRVPEDQLMVFVSDARKSFNERFSSHRMQ